jgi:DNA topoisomerase-6 subunit B
LLTFRPPEPEIVELSVSSWFYRNRAIAGFENPARSLYVSIREIVENSLDSCESISVLPTIFITLEAEVNEESEDIFSAEPQLFHLTIRDNGSGIPKENVPRLIGKMLTGTKFQIKQSRGTFGLGGSLALLYGQVTTQKPILIKTGQIGSEHYDSLKMRLDIENNTPLIIDENTLPKSVTEHGTTISFSLKGDWLRSKKRILSYFEQTSVMVPYASIKFETPDNEVFDYPRLTEQMPPIPKEMLPHPKGIDVEILKQMISDTKTRTLASFLSTSFQQVGRTAAKNFLKHVKINQDRNPLDLELDDLVVMMDALEDYPKFRAPSAESLAPAGPQLLEAGISRLNPEFVVVRQRSPTVYSGHPFIIEIGVGYGGELSPGITLLRFANRIPLLYD